MQSKRKRSLLVPFCVLAIAGAAVLIGWFVHMMALQTSWKNDRLRLAGSVGVNDMITENPAVLIPVPFGFLHLQKRLIQRTVDCRLKTCLGRIADIVHSIAQIRLAVVLHIVQTAIQPRVNDDDLIVCHYIDSRTSSHASRANRAASCICACVT